MESSPLANCSKWSLSAIWKWVSSVYQDIAPIICATALQHRLHNRGVAAVSAHPLLLPTPVLPPMCTAHPRLWALLEEAIPPGGRSWQKVAISLSRLQEGNFPLRGEDEGCFLCAALQRKCGPGQTAGGFCCSECAAPTLHGFPARTSGSQVRRYACEAISPLGYGCLKDSGHHRQIWDRHLAGYLVPAGLGL